MTIQTFQNFFLFSDQCLLQITNNNHYFVRRDYKGNIYEVHKNGEINYQPKYLNTDICQFELLKVRFPLLTFNNYLLAVSPKLQLKKNFILTTLHDILNNTATKNSIKKIKLLNFHLFVTLFLEDIPPISLIEKNTDINSNFLQTEFFEINLNLITGNKKKQRYFEKKTNGSLNKNKYDIKTNTPYFFSYLEIHIILEKIYPTATQNEIFHMRSQINSKLKSFGFLVDQRRFSMSILPRDFQTKLINTRQYTPQDGSIISYGFFGIRLRNQLF